MDTLGPEKGLRPNGAEAPIATTDRELHAEGEHVHRLDLTDTPTVGPVPTIAKLPAGLAGAYGEQRSLGFIKAFPVQLLFGC